MAKNESDADDLILSKDEIEYILQRRKNAKANKEEQLKQEKQREKHRLEREAAEARRKLEQDAIEARRKENAKNAISKKDFKSLQTDDWILIRKFNSDETFNEKEDQIALLTVKIDNNDIVFQTITIKRGKIIFEEDYSCREEIVRKLGRIEIPSK